MTTYQEAYSDLELSTQIVIKEALARQIKVDVLDRKKCVIRLNKGSKTEYIQQATRTSADSHVVSQLLDNKSVTKQILAEQGIRVPKGQLYDSYERVSTAFDDYRFDQVVIKPNSLSWGKGISFLPADSAFELWQKAFETAFQDDTSVIVEESIRGNDYRFLVIDFKCVAVLQRIRANVIGDGRHTIRELVEIKNLDSRRGRLNNTPLCPLSIDDIALEELNSQQLKPESIPAQGKIISLKKTANISTGGDSIDYTDLVHDSYKKMAEFSARTLSAHITGVDILIESPAIPQNDHNYAVVELNANPAISIHAYPYKGQSRPVESAVLGLLGF
jgi:glutamate--cysteine ligase